MFDMKRAIARSVSISVLLMTLSATAVPASAGDVLLNASFEEGLEGFAARGSESVSRVNTQAYDGDYSLFVSSRTSVWNGAAVLLNEDWQSGTAYGFSCAVYQESGEAIDMQLSLQFDDASGETKYTSIVFSSIGSGEWTVLSNPEFTIPADAENRFLYVETTESLCDFYVDSVISAPIAAEPVFQRGDVDHSGRIDRQDLTELTEWLLTNDANVFPDTADLDGNGILTAADLSLLRQFFLYPELTATTTAATTTETEETVTTTVLTTTTVTAEAPVLAPGQWNNTADVSWINGRKTVALSFDDGPVSGSDSAQRIQDALTNSGFHATFFYWGNRINAGNENEILEAEKRGFEVANHTWTHTDLSTLGAESILSEYTQCKNELNRILGTDRDYLVRLPYLGYSATVGATLPVPCPNCGLDSGDWNGASTADMVTKIQQAALNGSLNGQVVLMHETYDTTAAAMEQLCPWLEQNGYAVVTVSEMFKVNGKDMYAGQRYDNCW